MLLPLGRSDEPNLSENGALVRVDLLRGLRAHIADVGRIESGVDVPRLRSRVCAVEAKLRYLRSTSDGCSRNERECLSST